MGIEPTLSAWEADVLPMNYTRIYPQELFLKLHLTTAHPALTPLVSAGYLTEPTLLCIVNTLTIAVVYVAL